MTYAQFYQALRKFRGQFYVNRLNWIRCRSGKCPIESVAGTRLGKLHAAASRLGLSEAQRIRIVNGADYVYYSNPLQVRTRLLNALGLKERAGVERVRSKN